MNEFKKLNISDDILQELSQQGIKIPTPIQKNAIPLIKDGLDVIGQAQTGTGKTLAFLLPMFENMDPNKSHVQGLIITPTRELALQITAEAEKLASIKNLTVLSVFGGQNIGRQLSKLNKTIHLIVATPGRLQDHLMRDTINLKNLNVLVLDEVDQILEMGFREDLDNIISYTSKKHQTLCFSATINPKVKKLAYRYMDNPKTVTINTKSVTLKNIEQSVIECEMRDKREKLSQLLDRENPFMSIIFLRSRRRVDELEVFLHKKGYNCQKLHGGMQQNHRKKTMDSFRNLEIQYLISTDVASRGLDVEGITHIFNYDLPEEAETYIHRIGRTGRASEKGKSFTLVTDKDKNMLRTIEKHIKMRIKKTRI